MNTLKRKLTLLFTVFVFAVVFVPAINAQAETLNKPTGIKLNTQYGKQFQVIWDFDYGLESYRNTGLYGYGYEIQITNTKDGVIAKYDTANASNIGFLNKDNSKCGINLDISKLKTSAFKVKIRSYIYDASYQYTYSPVAEQVIVPRATVKSAKALSGNKAKVSWNKVSGAKNYTVYMAKAKGSKPGSFKKVTTTKKTSASLKNLIKYKDYYVYVCANGVKCGKKKYNSTKPVDKASNAYVFYIRTVYR
ncbi:MAG: hypothetical protein K2K56_14185 [Lachnospiraceae bacterium]|nr:hypothetical protein [Lachnospiraceae bacterium]